MRTPINAYRKVFKTVTFRSLIINNGHIKNVCVVDRSSPLCVLGQGRMNTVKLYSEVLQGTIRRSRVSFPMG
jgi:hypothetical protein